ncbi:hypothetical protein LX69_00458 [Breznakibacter xylanolyticus]|uniref:Uncharacterized protein n=1 Tax=Breznakibacter xylanolyticus TaxID=990 RepID=A0A2W7NIA7_9BACT|nr:hypothetical protein LX69_00458 [Breznakibacter xylanolyticus]
MSLILDEKIAADETDDEMNQDFVICFLNFPKLIPMKSNNLLVFFE